MENYYNILIADDHDLIIQGIKNQLLPISGYQIVGLAKNGKEALDFINSQKVDIVITDIEMPVLSGMELIQELRKKHPDIKIIAITMHIATWIIKKLNAFEVKVIVSKNANGNELELALTALITEKEYISDDIKESIIKNALTKKRNSNNDFNIKITDRELEVLKLIAEEHSTTEISKKLFISVNTVETHRKNLILKFGAKNSIGLIRAAIERNIL